MSTAFTEDILDTSPEGLEQMSLLELEELATECGLRPLPHLRRPRPPAIEEELMEQRHRRHLLVYYKLRQQELQCADW